jgi:hypothetical protein
MISIFTSLLQFEIPLLYDTIYISFGSKFNIDFFYLNKIQQWSNSIEQIMPIFIREKENHRSLLICIDSFSPNELQENISKIKEKIIPNILSSSNAHFILYNMDSTLQGIEYFLSYMTNYMIKCEIPQEKVFIANYICFNSPNHTENFMQEKSPCVIYNILCKLGDGIYKTRFFQWFGYQQNTYHLIYNYNSYRFLIGYSNILYFLKSILEHDFLNYNNLYRINNISKPVYLEIFLKNTMDITSPIDFCLYDYFSINDIS